MPFDRRAIRVSEFLLCVFVVVLTSAHCVTTTSKYSGRPCDEMEDALTGYRVLNCSGVDPWWLAYAWRPILVNVTCPVGLKVRFCHCP